MGSTSHCTSPTPTVLPPSSPRTPSSGRCRSMTPRIACSACLSASLPDRGGRPSARRRDPQRPSASEARPRSLLAQPRVQHRPSCDRSRRDQVSVRGPYSGSPTSCSEATQGFQRLAEGVRALSGIGDVRCHGGSPRQRGHERPRCLDSRQGCHGKRCFPQPHQAAVSPSGDHAGRRYRPTTAALAARRRLTLGSASSKPAAPPLAPAAMPARFQGTRGEAWDRTARQGRSGPSAGTPPPSLQSCPAIDVGSQRMSAVECSRPGWGLVDQNGCESRRCP